MDSVVENCLYSPERAVLRILRAVCDQRALASGGSVLCKAPFLVQAFRSETWAATATHTHWLHRITFTTPIRHFQGYHTLVP